MKGALNYERMDRFTGMAIVSYAWDDGIRSVGKHIEPYILWKACKRGTVVWNIGLRQKYSSYYKLGMRPGNAEALVKRYLALHRVGPLALYSWNEAGNFMMGAVMLTGLIRGIYRFQTTMQTGPALMDIGIGLVLALGLRLTGKIFSVERLQVITLNAICDYLENYLKSKLDGEYGYGPQTETPDHYARALKETAASRTKPGLRPTTVRRMPAERSETVDSTVDAKIVEDVLKEFLC